MSRCHIVWNRNPDVPRYLRGEAVEAYEERRNTGGRLRFFFYHLMFGVIIAISVLGPMFRPALLQGAAPEVIIGGYLAIGSPLALSAGPFRRFWLARLAAAHPVRIADDGLTFPTGLRGQKSSSWARTSPRNLPISNSGRPQSCGWPFEMAASFPGPTI